MIAVLAPPGEIRGAKWHDLDHDKSWDADEPPLAGWRICLDLNNNHVCDLLGTPEPRAVTDEWGEYAFVGLPATTYYVWEYEQEGWTRSHPLTDGGVHTIKLAPGQIVRDADFGNYRTATAWDYGDAPAPPYPSTITASGAAHLIDPAVYLGGLVDGEADGQPTGSADGDDTLDGSDDEDGVTFTSPLRRSAATSLDVTASAAGYLQAWVDFDQDGDWDDPGEQIFTNEPLSATTNSLTFPVPLTAQLGETFARFRFSTAADLPYDGTASDGEVEDYRVNIEPLFAYDYGDAPDGPYPTLDVHFGAKHRIVPGIYMGDDVDGEPNGQPHPGALGDDYARIDDEDGVNFTTLLVAGDTARVHVTASEDGFLNGWIDFDANDSWLDGGDQIFSNEPIGPGVNNLSFPIPASAARGYTFARFRFSKDTGLTPQGAANDGEVEDYRVHIVRVDWGDAPDVDEGPFITQLTWPTAQPWDRYGSQAGVSGDRVIIGGYGDGPGVYGTGAAWVHYWNGAAWVEEQKLTGSDSAEDDIFGGAVDISADWAMVGAPRDDDGGYDSGSVYAFQWDGLSWDEKQKISGGGRLDQFGRSVSIDGDRTVVGAIWDRTDYIPAGAAYVYLRSGATWNLEQRLISSDGSHDDYFGGSLSIDGDRLIVGARGDDHGGHEDAGSAYVFHRTGAVWDEQDKLTASDADADDRFGGSVGISGDWAIVGAHDNDHSGLTDPGAAYLYHWDGSHWTGEQKLIASPPENSGSFGMRVAISGPWAVVSEPLDERSGAIHVYQLQGSIWTEKAKWVMPDPNVMRLGRALALDGMRAVAGASIDWTGGYGAAFVVDWVIDPFNYPTLAVNDGAYHHILPGFHLGDEIDGETDGQPTTEASGDDTSGVPDDEDGVVFTSPIGPGAEGEVTVTASAPGLLDAWLDFDKDGDWDSPEEQIFASTPLAAGSNDLQFDVPDWAQPAGQDDPAYARFRLSGTGGLPYGGPATDGEVEDYSVEILAAPLPPVVTIAIVDPDDAELSWPHVTHDVEGNPIDVTEYRIYRQTTPYFNPDDTVNRVHSLFDPFLPTVIWIDLDRIGDPVENFYYYVKAVAHVGGIDITSKRSNHVAEFDFGIVPGS
jgi:hypothetical protein